MDMRNACRICHNEVAALHFIFFSPVPEYPPRALCISITLDGFPGMTIVPRPVCDTSELLWGGRSRAGFGKRGLRNGALQIIVRDEARSFLQLRDRILRLLGDVNIKVFQSENRIA